MVDRGEFVVKTWWLGGGFLGAIFSSFFDLFFGLARVRATAAKKEDPEIVFAIPGPSVCRRPVSRILF
jgi:hypothetical protein